MVYLRNVLLRLRLQGAKRVLLWLLAIANPNGLPLRLGKCCTLKGAGSVGVVDEGPPWSVFIRKGACETGVLSPDTGSNLSSRSIRLHAAAHTGGQG